MTETDGQGLPVLPSSANDNRPDQDGMVKLEQHLDTIASALGRFIAREQCQAWDQQRQAANDNRAKEKGWRPEG